MSDLDKQSPAKGEVSPEDAEFAKEIESLAAAAISWEHSDDEAAYADFFAKAERACEKAREKDICTRELGIILDALINPAEPVSLTMESREVGVQTPFEETFKRTNEIGMRFARQFISDNLPYLTGKTIELSRVPSIDDVGGNMMLDALEKYFEVVVGPRIAGEGHEKEAAALQTMANYALGRLGARSGNDPLTEDELPPLAQMLIVVMKYAQDDVAQKPLELLADALCSPSQGYVSTKFGDIAFREIKHHITLNPASMDLIGPQPRISPVTKRTADAIALRCGLKSDELVEAWDRSRGKTGLDGAVWDRLEKLAELERERPGAPKELRERYGLLNFHRYPIEVLAIQYDLRDTKGAYFVVATARDDHNAALAQSSDQFYQLRETLASQGFMLRCIEVSGKRDFARRLLVLHEAYGGEGGHKIAGLMVDGHGDQDCVTFGRDWKKNPDASLWRADLLKDPEGILRIRELFEDKAILLICGCDVGRGKRNLAKTLARVLNIDVKAANKTIQGWQNPSASTEDGSLSVSVDFRKGRQKKFPRPRPKKPR